MTDCMVGADAFLTDGGGLGIITPTSMSAGERESCLPIDSEAPVKDHAMKIHRLEELDSPNNNNNTSPSSSPKPDRVASGLLKMLSHDSILDGFEDLPPSDQLLDESEEYDGGRLSGYRHGTLHSMGSASGDGSFVHSHSDLSDDDQESPLQFHNERQFELEFKLHEAEQKVEQLTLQLKGKSMQLEQVQVALISYEEEIMQLRQHMTQSASDDSPKPLPPTSIQDPEGSVSLETAEQLSGKIIKLQQRVEELEDIMVYTKLDNAQLRETTDFLKSKLKQYTKKGTEKRTVDRSSSVRNLFGRK